MEPCKLEQLKAMLTESMEELRKVTVSDGVLSTDEAFHQGKMLALIEVFKLVTHK